MRAAGYCRVSTDREDQANSFEAQRRFFREYIQREPGWELYEIYADEGITGTSTRKRTQFNRMICDAFEGKFQRIVTKEVSRFSRNIVDTITFTRELKAIGVGVIFLSDGINTLDPDAELRLSIMASIAQEESRKTSSRVVWGQTRQMERGVVFGQSMLGYDVKGGHITINPEGAELVQLIFHKYALEQMGTAEIARYLTEHGYHTYRGSSWRSNKIIKILKNEKYVGDLLQKKSYTPDYLTHEKKRNTGQVPMIRIENHHEPIISREVWALAQDRLAQNNKHAPSPAGHSNRYVFSGKIKCGVCGSSFVGRTKKLKDGTKVRRWSCGREHCGIGLLVRDDDAMNMLKIALGNLNVDKAALAREVTTLVMGAKSAGESRPSETAEHLRLEMDRVRKKKEVLLDSFLEGVLSKEEMQAMKRKYDDHLSSLRNRLEKAEEHPDNTHEIRAAVQQEIIQLLDGQKESEVFYKHLLDQMTVFPDRHLELRLKHLPQTFHFR